MEESLGVRAISSRWVGWRFWVTDWVCRRCSGEAAAGGGFLGYRRTREAICSCWVFIFIFIFIFWLVFWFYKVRIKVGFYFFSERDMMKEMRDCFVIYLFNKVS